MSQASKQYQYEQAQKKQMLADLHVAAIVEVINFDKSTMTVDVQPLSQRLEKGQYISPSMLMKVPVTGICAGNILCLPTYEKGDIGVLLYLDHDMDAILARGEVCRPNTERNHSESDAVFIGGILAGSWRRPEGLPEGFTITSKDGNVYISVTETGIQIKGDLTVDGEVTANGIAVSSHVHSGVASGTDTTGAPQ